MLAITLRELRSYFWSPLGYIFVGFFLLINGFFFVLQNVFSGDPQYQQTIGQMSFWTLLVLTLLTMRLFSDEKRLRTDQLLLTVPVSVAQVVLAKYLAALGVFLGVLVVTIVYPITLSFFGRLPVGQIVAAYIGYALLGAAFIAVGMFVSALTENQLTAAIITLGSLAVMMWLLEAIRGVITASTSSGIIFAGVLAALLVLLVYVATKNYALAGGSLIVLAGLIVAGVLFGAGFFETFLLDFLAWFSLSIRFNSFISGVLALSPIVYLLAFAGVFVFLTIRVVEKGRWA